MPLTGRKSLLGLVFAFALFLVLFRLPSFPTSRNYVDEILRLPTMEPPHRVAHFPMLYGPTHLCSNVQQPVVFVVLSRIEDFEARNELRRLWVEYTAGRHILRAFVFGTSGDPEKMSLLEAEYANFGDVVVSDFPDTYDNLSKKTISGMQFMRTYCPHAKAMVKVDIDVLVHVPRLMATLDTLDMTRPLILGRIWKSSVVRRDEHDPNAETAWPLSVYPPYPSGPCYIVSSPAIAGLLDLSIGFPLWLNEDMNTGFMALHAKVPLINRFYEFASDPQSVKLKSCDPGVISMHKRFQLTPEENEDLMRRWGSCPMHSLRSQ